MHALNKIIISIHFAVFLLYIPTPDSIASYILYEDVMYTEYLSQVYPPFCFLFLFCWYRTLSSLSRQVCIQPVHSKLCSPFSGTVRVILLCWFVQCDIFYVINITSKKDALFHDICSEEICDSVAYVIFRKLKLSCRSNDYIDMLACISHRSRAHTSGGVGMNYFVLFIIIIYKYYILYIINIIL